MIVFSWPGVPSMSLTSARAAAAANRSRIATDDHTVPTSAPAFRFARGRPFDADGRVARSRWRYLVVNEPTRPPGIARCLAQSIVERYARIGRTPAGPRGRSRRGTRRGILLLVIRRSIVTSFPCGSRFVGRASGSSDSSRAAMSTVVLARGLPSSPSASARAAQRRCRDHLP